MSARCEAEVGLQRLDYVVSAEIVKKSSDVVQTFRSARHGRPEGLHYDSLGR
jgi:hypothetical protein